MDYKLVVLLFAFLVSNSLGNTFGDKLTTQEWTQVEHIAEVTSAAIKMHLAKGPVECESCKALVNIFKDVLQKNTSITIIDELAYQVCLRLDIPGWTPFVCHGTIREFGAEVIYVMTERFLVPEAICAALNFCSREETEFSQYLWPPMDTTKNPAWQKMMQNTLETVKQEQSRPPIQTDEGLGTFVHISDIHYDERYKVGANALCDRPLCCREASAIPGNQTSFRAAGQWGDYNCDPPLTLLQNMWQTLAELPNKPDFMIYTGDNSAHDVWAQTQTMQQQRSVRLFENIQEQLPGWTMYAALGNHESYPVDQFSAPPTMQWLYESVAESWAPWLSESVLETFRYAGYYTTQVTPGLRLISLNSQYCDSNDFWLLLDWQDPAGQIAWLNQTLQAAEAGNEKVWIIGHIPFNSGGCLNSYEEPLWSLVDEFKDTITALFFGHTHRDSFMVFKDFATNTKPIAIGYIAPSVTTYTNKNNAFRIVDYNRTTFEVVNYHQYILNLTEANASGVPRWIKEYDPIDAYGMNSLSPQDWFNVVNEKFQNDADMLELYQYYHTCSFGTMEPCTGSCKTNTICDLQASTNIVNQQCTGDIPGPGLSTFINRFCPSWWEQ